MAVVVGVDDADNNELCMTEAAEVWVEMEGEVGKNKVCQDLLIFFIVSHIFLHLQL